MLSQIDGISVGSEDSDSDCSEDFEIPVGGILFPQYVQYVALSVNSLPQWMQNMISFSFLSDTDKKVRNINIVPFLLLLSGIIDFSQYNKHCALLMLYQLYFNMFV